MSPDQFQTLALGWITTLTAIVIATGYAAAKVWPIIADIKARFDGLKDRVDRHGERLQTQDRTIATVALATPPPAVGQPAAATAPAAAASAPQE